MLGNPDFGQIPRALDMLPPDIKEIIKKKSSKDPRSRFANKLHILLSYAGNDPQRIEYIGAGWISDSLFKINKKQLGAIMEIKLNTLNVNLRDLGFVQMAQDHNGWTQWSRPGFHISSTLNDLAEISSGKNAQKDPEKMNKDKFPDDVLSVKIMALKDLSIGMCDQESLNRFKRFSVSIWDELVETADGKSSLPLNEFVKLAAQRFRMHKQKVSNAADVIQALFMCNDPEQVSLLDFAKFLAKFGPEETLMEKLGSIVASSNHNGNWLHVTTDGNSLQGEQSFYGYFDNLDQNCFILVNPKSQPVRIWNKVNVDSSTGKYLVDEIGQEYDNWDNYFALNPINEPQPAFPVPIYEW